MSTTIASLDLEIHSSSQEASKGLDALTKSLKKLQTATSKGLGLTAVVNELKAADSSIQSSSLDGITNAIGKLSQLSGVKMPSLKKLGISSIVGAIKSAETQVNASSLDGLVSAVGKLSQLGDVKVSSNIARQITAITTAIQSANVGGTKNIQSLVEALRPLEQLGKTNLSSYVTTLKKLPETFAELDNIDMGAVATKMRELADALRPLADEMQKVANGFSAFPKKIQKLLSSTNQIPAANVKASRSFTDLFHKVQMGAYVFRRIGDAIWSAIEKSNDYIENVNLFTVSMGEYAAEARAYADEVSEVMGIDPGEWMRNQGVFMTLATGFGVAGDRAALMSKNLTQLGYDISSFFNISYEDAMQKLQSGLSGELEPLRRIGYDLSQTKLQAVALELGIDKAVSAMTQAEKAELRYYAIMTQVTVAQGDMARTLDAPANQLRILKSQVSMAAREIGNIFIPALNAILPYAIAVTKVVRGLAKTIATLVGFTMPEVDYSGVSAMSGAAEGTGDALEDATKSAKKLKSYMMGFDELNVISPGDENALGADDTTHGFNFDLPEYDFLANAIDTKVNSIVEMIEGKLAEIELIFAGASLALGAILAFSGVNIPLGIALMGLGALGLTAAIATNWEGIKDLLSGAVGTATGIFSGAALLIGGVLAFSGANIPLGIALMMVGAAGLATTIAANWDSVKDALEGPVGAVTGLIGGALLGLGAILAFSGVNIPLGIALMLGGAGGLATVLAVNWDSVKNALEGPVGVVTGVISGAVLALGAILAFSGASLPLGIALMLLGASGLATVAAANWDSVKEALEGPVGVVTGIVSGAVLALGAIMAFSGANLPLGIALMLLGAAGLATVIATNWNSISDALGGPVGAVTTIVSGALLALGAIIAFTGAGIPLGVSLMLAGAAGLATMVALNWDSIKEALQGPVGGVTALISGAVLALGAILAFTGANIPLGIGLMLVGAAGLATITAVNWNTIKEALQGPVGGITALLSGALLVLGAILLFTGAGIPLGIGLMLAGAAGLATVATVNWDFITEKIKDIWKNIKKFWKDNIAPVFTAKWWKDLGKTCINGLIAGFEGGINGIIGGFETMINWIVDGLNAISFDIPDWLGGGHFGIAIPRADFGRVSIPRLAEGGFPAQGQLFIAREAGAEMVGSIGRKTAVANNDQIVSGIASGVSEANEEQNALLREEIELLRALVAKESGVYLDGRWLTNSVEKHQRERGRVVMTGGGI